MILNSVVQEAEMFGDAQKQSAMTMNVTPQSFALIIANLYTKPLNAIIREITTNAVEANTLSGTDRKVCIQVPDNINNDLIIRDFGPGLDDQEVEKYLNCLFSSSKTGSNEFMGGFGLTKI